MEDGNFSIGKEDNNIAACLGNTYGERPAKLTANGHDVGGECSIAGGEGHHPYRTSAGASLDDKYRRRINPLRIHLGKRPFVDNSLQHHSTIKKKKPFVVKTSDASIPITPRVPKLIPKRTDHSHFHHALSNTNNILDSERDKPVPRLVPKSQVLQFKKGKTEKGPQLKEYAQSLGLQPMVKFKCRKCCSMSFKTLGMLKEHQLVCRAQAKEPALSPEAVPTAEANASGPSRVTRKVYLCSACGTYYENWNLFLHMREVHNRHICLFCLGMFSKAEKLSAHLTNKHNVQEFNYESKEDFFSVYSGTLYLMCCSCDEICSEKDDFFNHDCNNVKPKPVPVLVSKNAVKSHTTKHSSKLSSEMALNSPAYKEMPKPLLEKKNVLDRLETQIPKHPINSTESETVVSDESISSDNSIATTKDTSNTVDSGMELESLNGKSVSSYQTSLSPDRNKALPNGDESIEHSDGNESSVSDDIPSPDFHPPTVPEELDKPIIRPPVEREKEGGIKLKLSLNKANSPVIINSTVDPTVGKQNPHKPPSRSRRPPKRYEKVKTPEPSTLPRTPSIKIKICDSADSPFVKTTIFENNQEISVRTLFNNNLENLIKSPKTKPESTVKTTIYDNKMDEELNTMNRVPKLTVRVPKELLDKDSSSDYSSDSDVSDKLTVDENNTTIEEPEQNITIDESVTTATAPVPPTQSPCYKPPNDLEADSGPLKEEITEPDANIKPDIIKSEPSTDTTEILKTEEEMKPELPAEPPIDTVPPIELTLDRPLDKYPLKELLKVFLAATSDNCIYCNHVRKIAVNCEQLSLHMVAEHRFSATVDSITAEELMPETIAAKVKSGAEELCSVYINFSTYDSVDKCEDAFYDHIFECFQCYFKTPVHKDLYLHNRKMHQKTILLCVMCKSNFYSYSELLCHLCPGTYNAESEIKFRCCLCTVDSIPSSFRLMVHLRKIHHTCDVCLEFCHNQARLSNHVWKHKLHHLCYRCGIAYRNKQDIANHLFWKHGTESALCKRCLQKKWPHVYHFCTPPPVFVCDECSLQFTKAVYLKVHKRFHSKEYPHLCTEEGCDEKFVSKKLLDTHTNEHKVKMFLEELKDEYPATKDIPVEVSKEPIPVIDLVADKPNEEAGPSEIKAEAGTEQLSKKAKKKKIKDKDALLLDVNLPALDLSESDSSDDSDVEKLPVEKKIDENADELKAEATLFENSSVVTASDPEQPLTKLEDKAQLAEEDEPSEQQVLDIWDNFKKYQAKVEKQKEKTPPLVPIRKHVCESDHDYCLIPTDLNGDEDLFSADKKKNKKSPKKRRGGLSSSSDSSSSDSSCSCGSNCSCSSSSGSSSSSSSDSDSSDESGNEKPVKIKQSKRKSVPNRRLSNGSNVDVMGMTETPVLIPEKTEPPIAEADLDTDESATDEEFYDEHPQRIANKLYAEKRNQLMLLASVAPSDGGSISGEPSRCTTPVKEEKPTKVESEKEKPPSSKKKSKKKKKSKSSKKQQQHTPIKINIPKEVIAKSEPDPPQPPLLPNKITISLQSNTVQIPDVAKPTTAAVVTSTTPTSAGEKKRASKRRRVPNKFYGYSSDEEGTPQTPAVLKPQQPPKLEWRKEDLPSPVTHKAKKEMPTSIIPQRLFNYTESIRLTAPIPDPEPPRILMNTESMDSSDSDSSDEGGLEIYQPAMQQQAPLPPTYLNSGTSSLPYAFQRPPVRQAREGESVYCYCRCPYDEVSEMIACDAEGCPIEWFHFECVGIMVPPKGKWYCPECRKNQSFSGYR